MNGIMVCSYTYEPEGRYANADVVSHSLLSKELSLPLCSIRVVRTTGNSFALYLQMMLPIQDHFYDR